MNPNESGPIIYESKLESSQSLSFSKSIDLLHDYRIRTARRLGLDLVKELTTSGIGFFLSQAVLQAKPLMSTTVGPFFGRSWISSYSDDEKSGTRCIVDFEFLTTTDELLVTGKSLYVVVNVQTGRPRTLPEEFWKYYFRGDFESQQSHSKLKLFDLRTDLVPEFSETYEVNEKDIDFYKHVSSGSYIRYVETLLKDFGRSAPEIREMEVQYMSPLTGVGTKFKGQLQTESDAIRIVFSKEGGTTFLGARIT